MSVKNGSAEIFELDDARARLRAADIDPKNYPTVGAFLEAVRDRQGLSVAILSDRTHVKASYIEAIERMAMEALPSKPYAIGFVRVYAEALGLDPAPVVERFKAESGFVASKKAPESSATIASPAPAERAEPARLSLLAVLAILGFMVWCVLIVTRPGPDTVNRPLKLDGVPAAAEAEAAPVPTPIVAAGGAAPEGQDIVSPAPEAADVPPQLLERIEPVYPPDCEAEAEATETVDLAFTVTPDGAVVSERVVKSSNPCFDRAALNAVKRWRFSPKTKDGAPRPAFEVPASVRFERPS